MSPLVEVLTLMDPSILPRVESKLSETEGHFRSEGLSLPERKRERGRDVNFIIHYIFSVKAFKCIPCNLTFFLKTLVK